MAQDQQAIKCISGEWTQITNSDAATITFETLDGLAMYRYTTNATAPTEDYGITYKANHGELQKTMAELTSLAGAVRMWAKPKFGRSCLVYVDHA